MSVKPDFKMSNSRIYAVIAFAAVFIMQVCLNTMVICMRSLPDEIGAVALAARFAGYDWNYVLTHPSMYYGSGTALLLYPFFVLVKNPLSLYQCLLGVGAFLHAIPAYIACRIVQNYYKITEKKILIIMIGIACAFFTPTRASNIDNEPMLICLCWVSVYLIIALMHTEKIILKRIYSSLWALTLAISYFSHTRAILYSFSALVVIICYRCLTKKNLVSIFWYGITYAVSIGIVLFSVDKIKSILFITSNNDIVANTPEELVSSTAKNVQSLFSLTGLQSFVDLFSSNLWIIFVFSAGTIVFMFFLFFTKGIATIVKYFKKDARLTFDYQKSIGFPVLFCLCGIIISMIGVCVIWLPNGMSVHLYNENLSRGHFYLRYYGNYFGPLLLCFLFELKHVINKMQTRKLLFASIGLVIFCAFYCVLSFLGVATIHHQRNLDWFYYFAPFSGMLNSWPNTLQTLSYFACSTLVSIVVLYIIIYLVQIKKEMIYVGLLTILLIWEYVYGVSRFDAPFSASRNYYMSVNSFYELYKQNGTIFEKTDTLYYHNDVYGPQYIVQFMILDKKVVTDLELLNNKNYNLILSSSILESDILDGSTYFYMNLDDNEYLYFNDIEMAYQFRDSGYNIQVVE